MINKQVNINKFKTKCNFCRYATQSGCMVTPSTYNCKAANDEYYQYINSNKTNQQTQKSLRPWDKTR